MPRYDAGKLARDALEKNRRDALALAQGKGLKDTHALLERAARELKKRIEQRVRAGAPEDAFTMQQMRATLAQVQAVTKMLVPGLKNIVVERGVAAAEAAGQNTVNYLVDVDRAFRGAGVQPLAIREAAMLDAAVRGARSSALSRLALSGTKQAADENRGEHRAKAGILQRYGLETIRAFEETMQRGILQRKSFREMQDDLTEQSPFLQGKPRFWAERIVRTELLGTYNRAGWEATREADEQLGDMVKVLVATFDDRTAADSYAVHGQVRRPEEAFETWYGLMQHPPARPNDREVVTPHRVSWPIPPALAILPDSAVEARWDMEQEGRKHPKPMPARPKMTTIPWSEFGKPQPLPKPREHEDDDEKPARGREED